MENPEFLGMDDEAVATYLTNQGYQRFRKLEDGEWILLLPLFSTLSVCCGASLSTPFKYRWCFKDPKEAEYFFETCVNFDDIPVKRASLKGHRYIDKPRLVEYDELGLPKW